MKELIEEGWVKKFTAREPQLTEYTKMYESLGFDVYLKPVDIDEKSNECRQCFNSGCDEYMVIYTRKKQDRNSRG